MGETADRVGFRCFDPINFQFTTEFELTFDERSARKRINALREYDLRRELQRRGQLEGLALEPDDFAIDEQMQMIERQVYSAGHPSNLDSTSDSGGGAPANKARSRTAYEPSSSSRQESESTALERSEGDGPRLESDDQLRGASGAAAEAQEPRVSDALDLRGAHDRESSTRHRATKVESTEKISQGRWPRLNSPSGGISDHYRDSACRMGDNVKAQSAAGSRPVRAQQHYDSEHEVFGDNDLRPDIRTGPDPLSRSPTQSVRNLELTDQDAGDMALNDQEADRHGPLTEAKLEEERRKMIFDPQHPRRPLRILPIGREEEDTEEFRRSEDFHSRTTC